MKFYAHAVVHFVFVVLLLAYAEVAFAQRSQSTTIVVTLPVDALLTVNGRPTSASGESRVFRDSQATIGNVYRYALRATVEHDGRQISQERLVRVAAGDLEEVVFQFPAQTTASKMITAADGELVAQTSAFQSRFQPRPGPASDNGGLPPLGDNSSDGFQPRTPDLGAPAEGAPPSGQFELPPLDDLEDTPRFGRQFGEETQEPQAPSVGDLAPPAEPAAPMRADKSQVDEKTKNAQSRQHWHLPPVAYIGQGHQHHLMGDTGTVLHVWHHCWRMANLQRSHANAAPYVIYDEVGHSGFAWAYGRYPFGCDRYPVFFKPGTNARWCFLGYAKRVRPFVH